MSSFPGFSQWVAIPNLAGLLSNFVSTDFVIATMNSSMAIGEIQLGLGNAPGSTDTITIKIGKAAAGGDAISTVITGSETSATNTSLKNLDSGDKLYLYISESSGDAMDLFGTVRLDTTAAAPGISPAYTNKARVKWTLGIPTAYTTEDDRIDELIQSVSNSFDNYVGHNFGSLTRSQYFGGGVNDAIALDFRPKSSTVGSITVTEGSTALVKDTDFRVGGRVIYRTDSSGNAKTWADGKRNVKAVYISGYDSTPQDIERAATEETVRAFQGANTDTGVGNRIGLTGKTPESGGSWSYTPDQWSQTTLMVLNNYRRWI